MCYLFICGLRKLKLELCGKIFLKNHPSLLFDGGTNISVSHIATLG